MSKEIEEKRFDGWFKIGDNWMPTKKKEFKTSIQPGMYIMKVTEDGIPLLVLKENNHDDLVHLPDTAFEKVVFEIEKWMSNDTRKLYYDNGFLYKRSVLLYGPPGSGKSCIVNRVANEVIQKGGIVLFNVSPEYMNSIYEVIDEIEEKRLVMVIFEELDQLVENYEEPLLHLLDGEIQRENVIYIATTNYLDKVPKRIMRPGRFSLTLEVEFPSKEAREYYLQVKLSDNKGKFDEEEVKMWCDKTEGFSIDELKETVLAVRCLDYPLNEAVNKIKKLKDDTKDTISLNSETYDDPEMTFRKNLDKKINKITKKLGKNNLFQDFPINNAATVQK